MKTVTNSEDCLRCKECCKLEEDELYFSPLFTKEEVDNVKEKVSDVAVFRKHKDSDNVFQIEMVKSGSIYVCPFLDEEGHLCKIYEIRPFDCRLWPFMVARVKDGDGIHIVCFDKCMCRCIENMPEKEFDDYKEYIIKLLKSEKYVELFKKYPELVWDYDPDTFFVAEMKEAI